MSDYGCDGKGTHYVHFTDDGKREKVRVKDKFIVTLLPSIEPKLKPQPDCSDRVEAYVVGHFWREFIRNGDIANVFGVTVPLPIKPELIRKPNPLIDYPGQTAEGLPLPQYYGLDARLQIPTYSGDFSSCSNEGGELQAFGGTFVSVYVIDETTGFPEAWTGIPDVFGGIVSVVRLDTYEELVEGEEEFCQIAIKREDGSNFWVKKVKGSCKDVEVQCEGDCPPGYCKCWISKAANNYCCRKCLKVSPVPTDGTSNNNNNGGNGNGNNRD